MKKRELEVECCFNGNEDPVKLVCMAWEDYIRRILAEKYDLTI